MRKEIKWLAIQNVVLLVALVVVLVVACTSDRIRVGPLEEPGVPGQPEKEQSGLLSNKHHLSVGLSLEFQTLSAYQRQGG